MSRSRASGSQRDFLEITHLLAEMSDDTESQIAQVSPWFSVIHRVRGGSSALPGFGIIERVHRLAICRALAATPPDGWNQAIALHDAVVALLARRIRSPIGILLRLALLMILLRESRDVPHVIEVLGI